MRHSECVMVLFVGGQPGVLLYLPVFFFGGCVALGLWGFVSRKCSPAQRVLSAVLSAVGGGCNALIGLRSACQFHYTGTTCAS